jgi:radical SAM superfamily enzyme YgiQ (UPF0313 family)
MIEPAASGPRPVLLISCYELGHAPLGLSAPAALLKAEGIPVDCIDLAIEPLDEAAVANACLVAISTPMHTALRLGVAAARRVREIRPGAGICFYGRYATLNAEHLLSGIGDHCFGEAYESGLVALARQQSGLPPAAAESVGNRHHFHADLGAIRHPDRYVKLAWRGQEHPVAQAVTTKGCRYLCAHCPVPAVYHGRFTAIDVDQVMAHIDNAVRGGARHVTFSDPDFLNGPTHARRVATALHERHPQVSFDYTAKISHLLRHPDLVEELRSLGNLFVVSAVESLDDTVLEHLDKGHTRTDAIEVFRHFRRIGLALRPSLVPFTPWETLDGYTEMLETLAREGMVPHIDPVQYSVRLLVPPGSLLVGSPAMQPHLDTLDADNFTWRWKHPDPRMDALQLEVAGIAASTTVAEGNPVDGWRAVRAAARRAAGRTPAPEPDGFRGFAGASPPRLTEAWFC